uniref:Replicative DNA helicase n=1 Tax=Synura uvella TaxID=52557 RepID=A0A3G2QZ92_9STRA|nr:replicative DNA helicase [Synura uvella]AYO28373.1 replicative DNA helicase [Synura uvella]
MEETKTTNSNLISLPHNFLAEQGILSILLTNPSLIKNCLSNLSINSFYHDSNKLIYETICELSETNSLINLTTIITKLQDRGILKKIGGIDKIVKLINRFENFLDLDEYIKIVNENYLRRLIIDLGKQIIIWSYATPFNLEEIISKIEDSIFNIKQQKVSKKFYSAAEIVDDIFNEIKDKNNKTTNLGYLTSFQDLDSIVQGFQKSDLIIIAGRPSMGKTAFSLNLAKNIIEKYKIPLIIFSLEMSRQQIIYRFISTESKINNNRLKSRKMISSEWSSLTKAMKTISELPIFIDDNPNLTLIDIRTKIKKIFLEKNQNGIIIIDYLQLMKLNFKLENRVQEISYLTRNLKIIAKEFNIPIILLSQLSRNVESRVNKRPMLSDLRESGCIVPLQKRPSVNFASWNLVNIIPTNMVNNPFDFKGIKPTYLITFQNGVKIQLTANHKILSKNGWIKTYQITSGTEIYSLVKETNIHFQSKYKYNKVSSIEYQGIYSVYDKTIPIFHNYIFNNIILHNSIEQDADIVIMIYREDYYQEKQLNSQITEFIVAKHRNGPVGTAKLVFTPSTTTFSNL